VAETIVVHPLGLKVVRSYLLECDVVTAITSSIGDTMLKPFPSIRLTDITAVEIIPRRFVRTLIQADCWAATQPDADRLGRVVLGALRASANYITSEAVMGETTDLSMRSEPDRTLTPHQPRCIVVGHVWIRPNP
jgi:hypothetical protein